MSLNAAHRECLRLEVACRAHPRGWVYLLLFSELSFWSFLPQKALLARRVHCRDHPPPYF